MAGWETSTFQGSEEAESIGALLSSDLSTRTTLRMQLTRWTGAPSKAGSSECSWQSMTGVREVMVGTGRGQGAGAEAEGGGRDRGAEAGGGQRQGLGQEAEGQGAGAEEEEGQGAGAGGAIPGAGAGIQSQVVIHDPSQGAGVEL